MGFNTIFFGFKEFPCFVIREIFYDDLKAMTNTANILGLRIFDKYVAALARFNLRLKKSTKHPFRVIKSD